MSEIEKPMRKAINFDLSDNELKKVFKDTRKPYGQIKKFLEANGFEHHQYSGYHSKEIMSHASLNMMISKLSAQLPWLKGCVEKFDVTVVGENYDLMNIIKISAIEKTAAIGEKTNKDKAVGEAKKPSVKVMIEQNKMVTKPPDKVEKTKSKNIER